MSDNFTIRSSSSGGKFRTFTNPPGTPITMNYYVTGVIIVTMSGTAPGFLYVNIGRATDLDLAIPDDLSECVTWCVFKLSSTETTPTPGVNLCTYVSTNPFFAKTNWSQFNGIPLLLYTYDPGVIKFTLFKEFSTIILSFSRYIAANQL